MSRDIDKKEIQQQNSNNSEQVRFNLNFLYMKKNQEVMMIEKKKL